MLTRCPHCQTQFRVKAEQLRMRQGKVRCGVCQGVFDALESLRDEILPTPCETPALTRLDQVVVAANESIASDVTEKLAGGALPPGAFPSESAATAGAAEEPASPPESPPATTPASEPVSDASGMPDGAETEAEAAGAEGKKAEAEAPSVREIPSEEEGKPDLPSEETRLAATEENDAKAEEEIAAALVSPRRSRRWLWAVGSVVLALIAAGQLIYIFRSELAVSAPELRPTLVFAFEAFGCSVPRPLKPDLLGIETSDLTPDGEKLRLTATMKNRAPFAQDYPHLEITLTDTQDAALVRKVIAPEDYLPAGSDVAAGFAPGSEINLNLSLTVAELAPAGYRLYLFYP